MFVYTADVASTVQGRGPVRHKGDVRQGRLAGDPRPGLRPHRPAARRGGRVPARERRRRVHQPGPFIGPGVLRVGDDEIRAEQDRRWPPGPGRRYPTAGLAEVPYPHLGQRHAARRAARVDGRARRRVHRAPRWATCSARSAPKVTIVKRGPATAGPARPRRVPPVHRRSSAPVRRAAEHSPCSGSPRPGTGSGLSLVTPAAPRPSTRRSPARRDRPGAQQRPAQRGRRRDRRRRARARQTDDLRDQRCPASGPSATWRTTSSSSTWPMPRPGWSRHNIAAPRTSPGDPVHGGPAAVFADPQIASVGADRAGADRQRAALYLPPSGRTATPPTAGRSRTPPASSRCWPTRPPGNCSAPTSSARRRRTLIQPLIQAMCLGSTVDQVRRRPVHPPGPDRGSRAGPARPGRGGRHGHARQDQGRRGLSPSRRGLSGHDLARDRLRRVSWVQVLVLASEPQVGGLQQRRQVLVADSTSGGSKARSSRSGARPGPWAGPAAGLGSAPGTRSRPGTRPAAGAVHASLTGAGARSRVSAPAAQRGEQLLPPRPRQASTRNGSSSNASAST